uniref:Uncharacterized protein n=1 Tax=Arundo donax TaxID=35708 RepID=A0A0A9CEN8_ARUDO
MIQEVEARRRSRSTQLRQEHTSPQLLRHCCRVRGLCRSRRHGGGNNHLLELEFRLPWRSPRWMSPKAWRRRLGLFRGRVLLNTSVIMRSASETEDAAAMDQPVSFVREEDGWIDVQALTPQ